MLSHLTILKGPPLFEMAPTPWAIALILAGVRTLNSSYEMSRSLLYVLSNICSGPATLLFLPGQHIHSAGEGSALREFPEGFPKAIAADGWRLKKKNSQIITTLSASFSGHLKRPYSVISKQACGINFIKILYPFQKLKNKSVSTQAIQYSPWLDESRF